MLAETHFSDRLRLVIGDSSVLAFAKKCGLSDGLVRKYLQGSLPGIDKLDIMAKAGNVNIKWLVNGEGLMRDSGDNESGLVEFAMISHYDVEASAGPGSDAQQEEEIGKLAFRKSWIRQKALSAKDLMAIRIKGDSMEPTIKDTAIALVDGRKLDFHDDGIYVLQFDSHLVAKRLQRDIATGGLLIKSDNPAYDTIHLPAAQLDSINIIGKIIWAGQEV